MKNVKFLILLIAIALINCERDDICASTTQTTPRLIVEFYDATDTDELLNVSRITVYGEGLVTDDDGNIIEPLEESDATLLFNENANTIELPLIIGAEGVEATITTRYVLEKDTDLRIEDEDDTTNSNIDIIEITYNTEFVYVSRACGYKSNFNSLGVSRETETNGDNWISNIEIEETTQQSIEDENTTHVRIYH
ncbi:hypothetical protein HSX10_13165 [Winogradskyella undariae]|uniref:DUF6452 family protein n=1 Tax=Winogradskyella TaxID=286104 RepID=UPI00156B2582|nr:MULTISPECIES: DUF6452 family protein [Winogradskyella]NRR92518.1 hypothetical protein [Winogradskyella undariae]QXP78552.1 hypothetical protein H0I32_15255 [Winogradskyella sp. HaHa_3_26]